MNLNVHQKSLARNSAQLIPPKGSWMMAPRQPSSRNSPRKSPSTKSSKTSPDSSQIQKMLASKWLLNHSSFGESSRFARISEWQTPPGDPCGLENVGEASGPSDGKEHRSCDTWRRARLNLQTSPDLPSRQAPPIYSSTLHPKFRLHQIQPHLQKPTTAHAKVQHR